VNQPTYTPMRLWTLLLAVTSTVLIAAAYIADAATPATLVNPAINSSLWAIVTLSWTGHLAAVCRDTVLRRIDRLAESYADASDRRAVDARIEGMRTATETQDPRPTLVRP